jgi:Holliday junction resolvasome RuvABC endonuclease subunit
MKISLLSPKPDRICSIDASTNSLAYAIFEKEQLVDTGKINFSGKDVYAKIKDAARKTAEVFDKFEVDAIVIEHTVFINSPKTMADLSMVQGALLGSAMLSGVDQVGSINPITWQTFIGNGRLSPADRKEIVDSNPDKSKTWYRAREREIRKEKTIRFVNTYYDLELRDDDVADAVGIGHYALNNWNKIFA